MNKRARKRLLVLLTIIILLGFVIIYIEEICLYLGALFIWVAWHI